MFINKKKHSFSIGGGGQPDGRGPAGGPGGNGSGSTIGSIGGSESIDVQDKIQQRQLELQNLGSRFEAETSPKQNGLNDKSLSKGNVHLGVGDDGPGGVATYGRNCREQAMKPQDIEKMLRHLRQEAQRDPKLAAAFLREHPQLKAHIAQATGSQIGGSYASVGGSNSGSATFS